MRLLYFTYYLKQGYGVSLVIKEQIRALKKVANHEIYVASYDYEEGFAKDVFLMKAELNKGSTIRLIDQLKPDVVIVHTPPFFEHVANYEGGRIIKIAYDHGEPFPSFFDTKEMHQRLQMDISKGDALERFHVHISISEFIKRHSGIANSFVIYNGCEHADTSDVGYLANTAHQYLSIPQDTFIISSLSRIGTGEFHYKGLDILMEIKANLSLENIAFVLIGKVAPGGNDVVREMKKNGFHVITDVDENTKGMLIKTSNLFISTSCWEGFNLPLVEAQYLAVLSACFSTGAHPEVCPFHFGNVNEMLEFIIAVCKDERLRARFAAICSDFVRRKFNWSNNASELNKILINKNIERAEGRLNLLSYNQKTSLPFTANEQDREILSNHLKNIGLEGVVYDGLIDGTYKITVIHGCRHFISIMIPNRDCKDLLRNCLLSIKNKTTYPNLEIVILENGSVDPETFKLYDELSDHKGVKILKWEAPFSYSAINNFGARHCNGDMLLFLNNDTEVINKDWIERLMDYATRKDVGAVGAKLYYPDNTIQHASVIIGIRGIAGHSHRCFPRDADGYYGILKVPHDVSAVTGACLMTRRSVFEGLGGFDENLPVAFNDIDYCLRARQKNYLVVWTPYAELYHYESKSRGHDDSTANHERFQRECNYFKNKWSDLLKKGDPYYNPNLTRDLEDFSIRE